MDNIITFLSRFKISHRIFAILGFAAIGYLILYFTFYMADANINAAKEENSEFSSLETDVSILQVNGLEMRRREKDFLLRKDVRFQKSYVEDYNTAQSALLRIQAMMADKDASADVTSGLSILDDILKEHKAQFDKVVSMQQQLGMSEEDGLQGALRDSVHNVEETLDTLKDDGLKVLMLMMRRHEKDFIMRIDPKYVDRMLLRKNEFFELLATRRIDQNVKQQLIDFMETYHRDFNAYAAIELQLVEEVPRLSVIYAPVDTNVELLQQYAAKGQEQSYQVLDQSLATAKTTMLITVIIVVLLLGIILYLIANSILTPLGGLREAIEGLAEGDNQSTIPYKDMPDAIGTMARSIEILRQSDVERIRLQEEAQAAEEQRHREQEAQQAAEAEQMARQRAEEQAMNERREQRAQQMAGLVSDFNQKTQTVMDSLVAAASEMKGSANSMVSVSDRTQSQVAKVSQSATDTNESVQSVASAVEEFNASINEVGSQVSTAKDRSMHAVEAASTGGKSVEEMSKASAKINDIISLISDIAE